MSTMSHLHDAVAAEQNGSWDEAAAGYEAALSELRTHGDRTSEASLLRTLGRIHAERGDYDRAAKHFEECLVLAHTQGERVLAAGALNSMASVAQLRGELDIAEPLYVRAGDIAVGLGDVRLTAMIQQNLGTLASTRGELPVALQRYREALEGFRELRDDRAAAWVLNNMGRLHADVGEYAAAELSFNAAYQLSERESDVANQAKIDANRADLFLKRQHYERAREYCDRAFRTFTRIASPSGLADVHRFYAMLYRETGRPQVARIQLALALRLARTSDNTLSEAEAESELARVFLAEGNFRPALLSLNRASELFTALGAAREIADLQRRLERLEEPYFQAMHLWTDQEPVLRAERTAARGARVGMLAARLIRALGQGSHVAAVRIGALLHDIGTVTVPRDIIAKPGPLTHSERIAMQQHAIVGESIVRELKFSSEVLTIARSHHEHWDGSGYPDGLSGGDIPLLARVVCMADVYDALTSDRAFRVALSHDQAMELMETEVGKTFDPSIFHVFRNLSAEMQGSRDTLVRPVFA